MASKKQFSKYECLKNSLAERFSIVKVDQGILGAFWKSNFDQINFQYSIMKGVFWYQVVSNYGRLGKDMPLVSSALC